MKKAISGLALLASVNLLQAATYDWQGPAPYHWDNPAHWNPAPGAGGPAAADDAVFPAGLPVGQAVLSLNGASRAVRSLNFDMAGTGFFIGGFGGAGSLTPQLSVGDHIHQNSPNHVVINPDILCGTPFTLGGTGGGRVDFNGSFLGSPDLVVNGPGAHLFRLGASTTGIHLNSLTILGGTLEFGVSNNVVVNLPVVVNSGGTLRVCQPGGITASFTAPSLTVNAGGALYANATVFGTTIVNGSINGGCSPGTLHVVGNFTLAGGATAQFELDTPGVIGGGVNDLIDVTGDVDLAGVLNVTALPGFGLGTYRLFNYSGTLHGPGLTAGSLPPGYSYSLSTATAGQVNLIVTSNAPAGYSLTLRPGYQLIANHLFHANELLDTVLPGVPDGSQLLKFDRNTQSMTNTATYLGGLGWLDDSSGLPSMATLAPGEGAFFFNPSGADLMLSFTGAVGVASLPAPIVRGGFALLSRQTPGPGTFENITGRPPESGCRFVRFDPQTQDYSTNAYLWTGGVGSWLHGTPAAALGESVFVSFPTSAPPSCLAFGGLQNCAVGNASLAVISNRLMVSNLGTQGLDGISINVGAADYLNFGFEGGLSLASPEGATVRHRWRTLGSNGVEQVASVQTAQRVGTNIFVGAAYPPLGAVAREVSFFYNHTLLTSFVSTGSFDFFMAAPAAGAAVGTTTYKTCGPCLPVCCIGQVCCLPEVIVYGVAAPHLPFLVSEVLIKPASGGGHVGPVSGIDILSTAGQPITLTGYELGVFDHLVQSAGQATLSVTLTNLIVGNLGSSGEDGVSIALGQAGGWAATFNLTHDLSAAGVVLHSAMRGRVNGVDDQIIGSSRIEGTGTEALLSTDFSSIGSATSTVRLLDSANQVVGSFQIPNNAALRISSGGGPWGPPVWKRVAWSCEPARDVAVYGWSNPVCVLDPFSNPAYLNVSTIEVSAQGITATREFVSRGTLGGAGVPSIELVSIAPPPPPACRLFAGLETCALGEASLNLVSNQLVISNLGTQGQDGISIAVGETKNFHYTFQGGLNLSSPDGAVIEHRVRAADTNGQSRLVAVQTSRRVGTNILVGFAFPHLGPVSKEVQFYSNHVLVARYTSTGSVDFQMEARVASAGDCETTYKDSTDKDIACICCLCPVEVGLAIPGAGAFTVSEIHVKPIGQHASPGPITGVDIVSTAGQELALTGYQLGVFGQLAQAEGTASLAVTLAGVTVGNLGTNGTDGVSLAFRPSPGASASIATGSNSFAYIGAFLEAVAVGTRDNVPGQTLGALRITRTAAGYETTVDFSDIISPTHRIQVLSNEVVLADLPGQAGVVAVASHPPTRIGKLGNSNECYTTEWPAGATLQVAGQTYAGNGMNVLAESTGVGIGLKTALEFRGVGVDGLRFIDVEVVAYAVTATIDGGMLSLSWEGPAVLEQSVNLGTWTAVPGNPVSPYKVPLSGLRTFFRLRAP